MRLQIQILLGTLAACSILSSTLAYKPVVILHGILSGPESMTVLVREIEKVCYCYWIGLPLLLFTCKKPITRSKSAIAAQFTFVFVIHYGF